ncbi:hypothetical protein [Treponema saccharophilum]|uniref:hypothetical protein n=1 Tax=Treponema saccharophilum TaxID=165 RepID=UPI001146ABC0|nr:hypothetical protein [Treponema saccharophilum]
MRKYNLYCAFFVRGANYESKEDYFYRIGCYFANGVVFARGRGHRLARLFCGMMGGNTNGDFRQQGILDFGRYCGYARPYTERSRIGTEFWRLVLPTTEEFY